MKHAKWDVTFRLGVVIFLSFTGKAHSDLMDKAKEQCSSVSGDPYVTSQLFATDDNCIANKYGELLAKDQLKFLSQGYIKDKILLCKKDVPLSDLIICFNEEDSSASKPANCQQVEQCSIQVVQDAFIESEGECADHFSDNDSTYLYQLSDCKKAFEQVIRNSLYYFTQSQYMKYSGFTEGLLRFKSDFLNKRWLVIVSGPGRKSNIYRYLRPDTASVSELFRYSWFLLLIAGVAIMVIILNLKKPM